MSETVPARLEAAIRADLHPVRRIAPPARRVLWLAPVAALTLIGAQQIFELRADAPVLGWGLTWGVSAAQMVAALALVGLALRHALPGRSLATPSLAIAIGGALIGSAIVTLGTWRVSPTTIVRLSPVFVGEVCLTGTVLTALPLLVAALALAARAYTVRPWTSGALYGLGAGLAADAGWRLFCHFSDPAHVFPTHTGGVLAMAVCGMLLSGVWPRVSAARRSRTGR
jgi:hypothetical protein